MYIDKGQTYVGAQTDKLIFFIEALSNSDIDALFGLEKQIKSVYILVLLDPTLIIEEFQVLGAFG